MTHDQQPEPTRAHFSTCGSHWKGGTCDCADRFRDGILARLGLEVPNPPRVPSTDNR